MTEASSSGTPRTGQAVPSPRGGTDTTPETASAPPAAAVIAGFAAVGAYLYLSALSTATGGRAYPLGRPLVR
jgi:hypothetical protein